MKPTPTQMGVLKRLADGLPLCKIVREGQKPRVTQDGLTVSIVTLRMLLAMCWIEPESEDRLTLGWGKRTTYRLTWLGRGKIGVAPGPAEDGPQ